MQFSKTEIKYGAIWSFIAKFGGLIISFISNLILSRILTPEDYGSLGIVYVFYGIFVILADSGFSSALIQRKNVKDIDYSTIFYFNFVLSIILYFILFYSSDYIEKFVNIESISELLKAVGLALIVNALFSIQKIKLQKAINYKTIAKIDIVANIISSTIAIYLATLGYGVWSLVFSLLILTSLSCIIYWIIGNWKPMFNFSINSLKSLFNYGGIIMVTSLIEGIYINFISLIIGSKFSVRDLGFYTQAYKLQEVPEKTLASVFLSINFPHIASLQDNLSEVKRIVSVNVRLASFISAGLTMFLFVAAEDIIVFLYTDKWIGSVIYFQILCTTAAFYLTNTICANVPKSLGRTKMYFTLQTTKRVIGIVSILVAVQYGIIPLVCVVAMQNVIWGFINIIAIRKIINYGFKDYLTDISVCIGISLIATIVTSIVFSFLSLPSIVSIILMLIVYSFIYLWLAYKLKLLGWKILYDNFLSKIINKIL